MDVKRAVADELAKIEQGITEGHPGLPWIRARVKLIEDEITKYRTQYEEQERKYADDILAAAKVQLDEAVAKEQALQKEHEQLQEASAARREAQLAGANEAARLTILENDLERTRKLFDVVVDRIREVSISEDHGVLNIRIVDPATVPSFPIRPQKSRIVAMAGMLGLMIGVALCFLIDSLDQRMRGPDEIERHIRLPVLGIVPHIARNGQQERTGPERVWCLLRPKSGESEAVRTIRTGVCLAPRTRQAKVILVTSPNPNDGKTSLAANLAVSFAQNGERVLLIDADFRHPDVHSLFGIDRDLGLSSVLVGDRPLDEVLVVAAGIPNLSVAACGPVPPNPAELLSSQEFVDFLTKSRDEYDRIILDSPPVLPVADSRILAAQSDAVLLVMQAAEARRKPAMRTRDLIESVGGNLAGVVLNDVPRTREGYYYQYGYYGHYGQRYGEEDDSDDRGESTISD